MTDSDGVSADQLARIERLRRRRAGNRQEPAPHSTTAPAEPTPTADVTAPAARAPRRRHPALRGRIAAAGLGASTMFGIMTVLGLDTPSTSAGTPTGSTPPQPARAAAAPAPVKVVIHRVPVTTGTVPAAQTSAAAGEEVDEAAESPATTSGPIALTATPVVRTITVEAAPSPRPRPAGPASAPAPAPPPAPAATTSGSS